MFSGIVTDVGKVAALVELNGVRRLSIESTYDADTIAVGASIACAGICLTVLSCVGRPGGGSIFQVDLGPETLKITTAGNWQTGTDINLERSLRIGEEINGHLVSGHIDGLATIVAREHVGDATRFAFTAPMGLARFIAPKGSIALDGTSLTVNGVSRNRFDCMLIPHTLKVTTWDEKKTGDKANLEVDQIARYVARLLDVDALDAQRKD
jgi:riboflavin synthase